MTGDALVRAYLERLGTEARRLPAARRSELVEEIRGHIELALDEAGSRDEATVRTALDRLGSPEAIVDAEADSVNAPGPEDSGGAGRATQRWGAVEVAAALLLTLGMILLPVFGPLLGLGLVWMSSYWTIREKIVVTAVVLALLIVPALGLLAVGGGTEASSPGPLPVDP
ncbi:MAG TPA: hypothetical protein VFR14_13980 [Candidatus Limnocylindrales bacterium]|nr:hypothetical protein [Candidatus Limnocylindrales bacterium]